MPSPDFQVESKDGTIAVGGRLDFSTASQVLQSVNEHIKNNSAGLTEAHVIDLAGVTHSNSAGLALMIEWLAVAQRSQQSIRFQNIPDSLRQISTVCQVDSLI